MLTKTKRRTSAHVQNLVQGIHPTPLISGCGQCIIIILLLLGQDQEKGDMKGGDIIHHHLWRGGEGGATHVHLDATIEGKEQFY